MINFKTLWEFTGAPFVTCTLDISTAEQADAPPPYTVTLAYDLANGTNLTATYTMSPTSSVRYATTIFLIAEVPLGGNIVASVNCANNEWAGGIYGNSVRIPPFGGQSGGQSGFQPARRTGIYKLPDFVQLNSIERSAGGLYIQRDLDFVNVQTLSMAQAATKCRAIANATDPTRTSRSNIVVAR